MSSNKRLRLSDPSPITSLASTSSSSIQKRFKYDVFISFRGDDTRKTFVDHLYEALKGKGIYTYKDDEKIEQGKTIDFQLIQAIRGSRFFIIVFSHNYASSSWCLDELVEIMECQKTGEQTAYPVFFDVEPTHVRYQRRAFGEAFLENKNKDAAGKWIDALKGAAGLAGWELKNTRDGHEAKFIKKIVQQISLELRSINFSFDEKLVGMETRARDVISSLEIGIDEVRMIGIKGMGGAGKTTTARAVFDHLSADFKAKIFVEDVREVSNASMFGLKKLQEQVISKVLNEHVTLDSVTDGKKMMKRRMCGKKVLLVLDDVDHIDQLEALAGGPNWFKPGSRVIVTTRDEQILIAHRVNLIRDINLLSVKEAICLFSRYAFGTENPVQGYEKLSGKVVRYAAGLPLTVKVLGSFLCGKDKLEWVDAIDRSEKIPLKDTLEKLELSYISLEDEYKEIFLDIACILKGQTKEKAIRILESCGFLARIGLKVLEQRSLITISKPWELGMDEPNEYSPLWILKEIEYILANDRGAKETRCLELYILGGKLGILMKGLGIMKKLEKLDVEFNQLALLALGMHDHIEEMGKNLIRRLHPDEPEKHSRLWIREEIEDILANGKGTEETRCLKLDMQGGYSRILMKGLEKMKKLRYLEVNFSINDYDVLSDVECLDNTSQYFSNSLKYLKCWNYPFLYLPKTFQPDNLVGLKMKRSKMEQLWEEGEIKVLKNLKFLSLSLSKLTTFDFRITPNLGTLSLKSSGNLELRMPVSCQKLKHLNISHSKLRTFNLGLTPNLERLSLTDCADFEELHVSVACPNLKFLDLHKSRLGSLDLELIPNLERLCLLDCDELVEINAPVGCLKKVGYLNLSGCKRSSIFVFPSRSEQKVNCSSATLELFGELLDLCPLHPNSNLPKLRFGCYYEENLPSSVGNIEKLISFGLCSCTDLKKISDMICSLRCLKKLKLNGDMPEFPKDLGQLECLEELSLYSTKIKHLPDSICMLKRLKSLKVSEGDLLEKLPEELGRLECLEKLHVRSKRIEYLPDSICMLKRLKELYVTDCCRIGKLPEDIGQLESLERLVLTATTITHLPDSVCMLKHLKHLNLHRCALLGKLPENIGHLESLEMLDLSSTEIKHLPDSICMLKHLMFLNLSRIYLLEKLPEDLGKLECLEKLHVSSMMIEFLPDSICMLKRLKELYVECRCLGKLPEDIGQLKSMERLNLSTTKIKHLPDSICMLKHLKFLNLSFCHLLEKLPEDVGRLECLEELDIRYTGISHLPDSICMLKYLKYLNLEECALLEKLPEDLGRLECLEKLDIVFTGISYLPQSIFGLKGLCITASRELLQLYDFPSEIETRAWC